MKAVEQVLAAVSDARVLVIDDNPTNTLLARRILQKSGLEDVIELLDPTRTRDVLREQEPDLVLLDLRMPGMDGFEVLDTIRRHAAATYLPVIVVTADTARESLERALSMGASDFVTKPFNASELALRVRNLLVTRHAYQELRRSRAFMQTRLGLFEPDLAGVDVDLGVARRLIESAIAHESFDIYLQPVVDMRDGAVVGAEALARFDDDVLQSPAAWFAAALEVGLIAELEQATFLKALSLVDTRPPGTSVSVNLSPATLLAVFDGDLPPGVPWERVVIELTEHLPVEDYASLNRALGPLRALGARIAVDDAGAGFASLRHILDLRPDIIKIDIGITRGVDQDPSRAAIARMLVDFANSVGITVVAEGVETAAERDALIELGGVFGQGFLFGRPQMAGPQAAYT